MSGLPELVALTGVIAIVVGVGLYSVPLAVIVGGLLLVALAALLARARAARPTK